MTSMAYYTVLILIFYAGSLMLRGTSLQRITAMKARLVGSVRDHAVRMRSAGTVFCGTAFEVDRRRYDLIRLGICAAIALIAIAAKEEKGLAAAVLLYGFTLPVEKVGALWLPYGLLLKAARRHREHKIDTEILEAMACLKNTAVTGGSARCGTDLMIEQLAGCGNLLKPIYFKMLHLLRINRKEAAIDCFARETGTKNGRDFARLLVQLDQTGPEEFMETLVSCQKNIREVKITRQKQQDETLSDLLYLPVVVNVLLIFINFIYVSYFIEQKNMFKLLIE